MTFANLLGTPSSVGRRGKQEEGVGGAAFVPSYEWQLAGDKVPPGLEIDMPLDGISSKRARIPPRWRLCVWVSDEHGFFRCDCDRSTTFGELRRKAAIFAGVEADRVQLRFGQAGRSPPVAVDDAATAEETGLFSRLDELVVRVL